MKQHLFNLDVAGQRRIEQIEEFKQSNVISHFNFVESEFKPSLCDTCTKTETCDLYAIDLGDSNIAECSEYGKPN